MNNIPQISESELEVMKILWQLGSATSSQIVEKLSKTTEWKPKTIQTLITRLVSKEAVEVDKSNKKPYIYLPKINEEEYKAFASTSFIERLYNGSVNMMISSFIKNKKMSKEDIQELKNLLDE